MITQTVPSKRGRKLLVAGAGGFIGSRLVELALRQSPEPWTVVTLDRTPSSGTGCESLQWDGENLGPWVEGLKGVDAVVNLAGFPISVKWDEANREKILNSRVNSTRVLGRAFSNLGSQPRAWINASAVGYYGDRGDTVLYENAQPGVGFLSEVCRAWEIAAEESAPTGTRVALMRTGLVLGRNGGAFKVLRKIAQFGLGGAAGSGAQWAPWIHLDDICRMYLWAIDNERVKGPINGSAPEPVRNRDFMAKLRKELNRPWSPPAPSFALKLLGELGGPDPILLLGSTRAVPRAAIDNGFNWAHPTLTEALDELNRSESPTAFVA